MISKIRKSQSAFTLVEIMIVVAIIGLLAALAVPGFVKARKQSQGRRILNDVRQIDAAIDQAALEKGWTNGTSWSSVANVAEVSTYLKSAITTNLVDYLGNGYVVAGVGDAQIGIAAATKSTLDGAGIDWGNY